MRGLKNNQFLEICLNVFFQWQKCKYPALYTTRQVENNELFPMMRIGSLLNGHGEFFALLYCRRSVAARESRAIGQKGELRWDFFISRILFEALPAHTQAFLFGGEEG